MGEPVTSVTIVGGGTAGWLAATLLNTALSSRRNGQGAKITLIESPNVPTVGVGEATVPGMPRTLQTCGIRERDFFRACNASFKLGVLFSNWNVDDDGAFIDYINPFARPGAVRGVELAYHYLNHGAGGQDFIQTYCPVKELIDANKGPRRLGAKDYQMDVGFAYHLDAGAFAGMLRDVCIGRGVVHVRDDVVDVEQDTRGYITALTLKEQGRHDVELVLDCTGFRGVLINQVLDEPFISYSKHLANDRALAVQIPHRDPKVIPSVTRSTALGAGWSWRVPLYHRIGTGYVFSSAHRSDEEATDEFLAHLGLSPDEAEPRVIPMRVGRSRNLWVRNCVAVGLSGGFIEPLESTAIHMIDMAIRWLVGYFPDRDFAEPLRARYNKLMIGLYDEVRDFICLHYALNNRTDDPYWIDARALEVPDRLAENLELWKRAVPQIYDLESDTLFSYGVYQAVMLGKRVYDTGWGDPTVGAALTRDPEPWRRYLQASRPKLEAYIKEMPDHRALLDELRAEPQAAPSPFGNFGGVSATIPIPGQPTPIFADRPMTAAKPDKEEASLL